MKKIFLTTAFIASLFSLVTAQDLHFGVQMSPSFSWMTTTNSKISGSGASTGLKLALIVENRFSQAYWRRLCSQIITAVRSPYWIFPKHSSTEMKKDW